ncbi:hypothetical protein L861_16955 [Litchfieldella anticariensis FP35 = DSM 16096]|uniref:Uncharacterized protein n=1 Tax=Litchfieldella anticariensis (strain DSM 16096 / CECT 5854 / CIP 108499 / LMG 22089 / FP35) TaxID=1121939 RepID=S2LA24_LITA3|nr:DUF523 domain-containing protein [Halomonas anticariensis]EPC01561.1 hypothetical protein L861_16955 [Halomonas anticariensis FP35 = DSM 16096]
MTTKILISACLLGNPVRYNGSSKEIDHPLLAQWQREGRLVPICPEVVGGMPTPRPPAEIEQAASGADVLESEVRILDDQGDDVTASFVTGARLALQLAQRHGCRFALLTDGSPSCGSREIHDGSFSGVRHPGEGVTTALLRRHGIEVFAHTEVDVLAKHLKAES